MSDTFSDTGEYVLTKISKMRPITAAFVAVLLMIFIQLLRLQSLFDDKMISRIEDVLFGLLPF